MIGETLSHFQIQEEIGRGGMGIVYKARDVQLGRSVAIKILPAGVGAPPDRKRRFLQEAQAASALNHPNIVTIYEIGQTDTGAPRDFIAMEYITGVTLDALIGVNGLAIRDVLHYGVQISDALAAAHAAGIVHRDLKPANVMIAGAASGRKGHAKVLDFGLAKLNEMETVHAGDETATMRIQARTEPGIVLGSIAYMSPEQIEGRDLDGRSDMFSFGTLLYEMVTGRQPFARPTRIATLTAVLRDDPPAAGAAGIDPIIRRCLQKQPDQRFANMNEVRDALETLRLPSESTMLATPPATLGPIRACFAAAFVLLFVSAAVAWLLRSRPEAAVPIVAPAPLTSFPGRELHPSFSPDGSQIAFCWNGPQQDNYDVYVKLVGPGEPLRLTQDPLPEGGPAWSPDGRWIAFARGHPGPLLIKPALGGGAERPLIESRFSGGGPYLCWTSDSRFVIVEHQPSPSEPSGLFAVSVDSGQKQRLTSSPFYDTSPAVSPDGRTLAFVRVASIESSDIWLLPLNGNAAAGQPRRFPSAHRWNTSPAWTRDGSEIVYVSGAAPDNTQVWRAPLKSSADPRLAGPMSGAITELTVSRGASRLAFVQQVYDYNIWRMKMERTLPVPGSAAVLIASTHMEKQPDFSPDGRRIAFGSNRSGADEIWICDSDGRNASQLTSFGGPAAGAPRWSPDGREIVFDLFREGLGEIFTVNAEGGLPRLIAGKSANEQKHHPSWSRDGRWVYFTCDRAGTSQIWKAPAAGPSAGPAVQVTQGGGSSVALESADGRYLYYNRGSGFCRRDLSGKEEALPLPRSSGGSNLALGAQGIYFVVRTRSGRNATLSYFPFEGDKPRPLLTFEKPVAHLAVSPDETTVLYTQLDQEGADLMLVEPFR